jgi:elongation factor P
LERNFHQNEPLEEIEIEKQPITYLYNHRGEFWFSEKGNPKNRFKLEEAKIGPPAKFLKPNSEVTALKLDEQILSVKAPIKIDLKVTDAPPGERGNTAQGGTKTAALETGAQVAVPLFVNTGDIVRVNTETGEYVERTEKAR